ncbi:hypothetical protein [Aestuariimicrobium ganziense]|uniref:hypothetical protein n=1 Tax=Aestuariimicrobium ganziense TaxID=2773677 RepID=UPI001942E047|nr:hypothetical protein [Aestuariimicrobium ganziense]
MPSTARRIAAATVAAFALIGSTFALNSQAKGGLMNEGEFGTDGNLNLRVSMIQHGGENPDASFLAQACNTGNDPIVVKDSDFTLTNTDGKVFQIAKFGSYDERTPFTPSGEATLTANDCITGNLTAFDVSGKFATVNWKGTTVQWVKQSTSNPSSKGNVNIGETAQNDQGLIVTVSDLTRYPKDGHTMNVKVCSANPTTFTWDDITVVDGKGTVRVVGHSNDDLGPGALPLTSTLDKGSCAQGVVSFYAPEGVNSVVVRGLIFLDNTGSGDTGNPDTDQPSKLPKTGN